MFRKIIPTWKFIIVGDFAVGKTSLCKVFSGASFSSEYKPTLGVDIFTKVFAIEKNFYVNFQIWDLAGQERFKRVLEGYFRGAKGGAVVFDITRYETYKSVDFWVKKVKEYSGDIPLILVGNKIDLEESRVVSREDGIRLAKRINLIGYIETSAKSNINVNKVFVEPFKKYYELYKKYLSDKKRST